MTDYQLLNMWLEERGIRLTLSEIYILMPIIDMEELLAELGIDAKELESPTKKAAETQARHASERSDSIVVGITPPYTEQQEAVQGYVKSLPPEASRSPYGLDYFGRNYDPRRP